MSFVKTWFRAALGFTLAAALLAPSVNLQAEASEGGAAFTPATIVAYEPSEGMKAPSIIRSKRTEYPSRW